VLFEDIRHYVSSQSIENDTDHEGFVRSDALSAVKAVIETPASLPPYYMCHFGISPPPYNRQDVLATVNVTQPNIDEGFRGSLHGEIFIRFFFYLLLLFLAESASIPIHSVVFIKSLDPTEMSLQVVHTSQEKDFRFLADSLHQIIEIFEVCSSKLVTHFIVSYL
jgi:hypothetical protein